MFDVWCRFWLNDVLAVINIKSKSYFCYIFNLITKSMPVHAYVAVWRVGSTGRGSGTNLSCSPQMGEGRTSPSCSTYQREQCNAVIITEPGTWLVCGHDSRWCSVSAAAAEHQWGLLPPPHARWTTNCAHFIVVGKYIYGRHWTSALILGTRQCVSLKSFSMLHLAESHSSVSDGDADDRPFRWRGYRLVWVVVGRSTSCQGTIEHTLYKYRKDIFL